MKIKVNLEELKKKTLSICSPPKLKFKWNYGEFAETSDSSAETILRRMPELMEREASKGYSSADVMWVNETDYDRSKDTPSWICKPEWLKNVTKEVWEACKNSELNPRILQVENDAAFLMIVKWA